ncbi:sorting nexin-33-like isoform X2 [Lytechinus variegatus]|uniref:sorting nexin-33-like isoform X2 n=1 Tax=Lytechinus variegatus TaxID=7654 RepID=UPI001BB24947|nr:sorting nexin-33-like isoform X2 [Lytechinus variegatus]
MAKQCKVLYDFTGEAENGELTIYENEVLQIVRQDVGEGWWEARNPSGQLGLVPEAYVEMIEDNQGSRQLTTQQSTVSQEDDWDDEWDDRASQSSYDAQQQQEVTNSNSTQGFTQSEYNHDSGLNGNNYGLSAPNRQFKQRNHESTVRSGTVKKNFASRFSVFAKTGGEAYLLGAASKKGASPDGNIRIIEAEDGPRWEETVDKYTCEIKNPKKESKLKGMKSFIAYQVTPSNTGIRVSRRYKHFDWLYERLAEKFTLIIVPPLPDKQVTGRYEEAFIEKRMDQLQRWMNRMTAHPVIGPSDVMMHFISCTDEKLWKQGKRKAEKDEYLGAAFYQNIEPPSNNLDLATIERQHDTFTRFTKSFDTSVAQISQVIHDYSKKHLGPFKREYQKIGNSFTELATTFNLDNRPNPQGTDDPPQESVQLTEALNFTGKTYEEIGQLFYEQPKYDLHPFEDFLKEYGGMMSCFPDMIHFHKHTIQTVKECQKQREEQKMDFEEAEAVKRRADVISYAMMAEVNHFHRERVEDFKWMMQVYLKEQIKFYKSLTIKLEEALQKYDELDR